jgi:predicted RNA-binding Zn-ribbon protein involved in translation (DUF1610 family)
MWWGTKERRSGIPDRRAERRGGRRGTDRREKSLMLRACPDCGAMAMLRSVTRMEGGFLLRYRCAGCAEDLIITMDH